MKGWYNKGPLYPGIRLHKHFALGESFLGGCLQAGARRLPGKNGGVRNEQVRGPNSRITQTSHGVKTLVENEKKNTDFKERKQRTSQLNAQQDRSKAPPIAPRRHDDMHTHSPEREANIKSQ
jgi:hypothetical protein